ncbi:MAG: 4'-phosphopantetheinyl transferase superfamily protein [Ferruginibacter sp.]
MPLVYQQNINLTTRLGVWHITEEEAFFMERVFLQREITHPHKRLQHLAGRYLLTEMFPGFPAQLIRVADTRKPFLENDAYHFSISHCGEYAAVMVSTVNRVGVDIEKITAKVEKVKHKFLSPAELSILSSAATSNNTAILDLLTAAWGIKEALFKWFGSGEIDFIAHLKIAHVEFNGNEGIASCIVQKEDAIHLPVHFLFFNGNCISWTESH